MADQHHLRYFLDIPQWYFLFEEEIARYNTYILECNGAVEQVMFYKAMDCSPFAWCASFVIALNPFVCVHTQHTDSIKLLFIHNPPPMMPGSPTTPATANQFINMTSSSNPVQQPKTTSASRSNLPGMYSWQNPQVYYDF